MSKRIETVRDHFKRNKTTYVTGTMCLIAGATGGLYSARKIVVAQNKQIQLLAWKSTQILEVHIEALGDPGNIIQDVTTGTVYASQNQAARALGVSPARISEHISGKLPHVQGHKLTKLGKAFVSPDSQ